MINIWRKARYSYNRIHNRKPNETNKQVKTTSPMFATWPRLSRLSQTHHSDIFWCETLFGKLWNLFGGVSKQKVFISNLCFGLWQSHSCQVVSNLVWANLLLANTLTYTQTTRTLISYEGRVFCPRKFLTALTSFTVFLLPANMINGVPPCTNKYEHNMSKVAQYLLSKFEYVNTIKYNREAYF